MKTTRRGFIAAMMGACGVCIAAPKTVLSIVKQPQHKRKRLERSATGYSKYFIVCSHCDHTVCVPVHPCSITSMSENELDWHIGNSLKDHICYNCKKGFMG